MELLPDQLEDLREYIIKTNLDQAVITLNRREKSPRPLIGRNSRLLRTLGDRFSPTNFQPKYHDDFRGKEAQTEFAEFVEAVRVYDLDKSEAHLAEVLLEAADILYQDRAITVLHQEDPEYTSVKALFVEALEYVGTNLLFRSLKMDQARIAARVKYGSRAWHRQKDLPAKNKDLERKLAMEFLAQI